MIETSHSSTSTTTTSSRMARDDQSNTTVVSSVASEEQPVISTQLTTDRTSTTNQTQTSTLQPPKKYGPKDFIPIKIIGEGSFSTVVLAKLQTDTSKSYAVKICEKARIKKEGKISAIFRERDIMNYLDRKLLTCPFFVRLAGTFQDEFNLYFVMTYARNGELLDYMRNGLDSIASRFYAAEILIALEHLHSIGIVHRDLKPENILLNDRMHILITDFGSAMIDDETASHISSQGNVASTGDGSGDPTSTASRRRRSSVGTAEYLSPEMWISKEASVASDIWALAVIVYQMMTGNFPFRDDDLFPTTDATIANAGISRQDRQVREYRILKKIEKLDYSFPESFDPIARDFVESILKLEPMDRLGVREFLESKSGRYSEIRRHPYFESINNDNRWSKIHEEPAPLPIPKDYSEDESDGGGDDVNNMEIGFNLRTIARLTANVDHERIVSKKVGKAIPDPGDPIYDERITRQSSTNLYHRFVENNLILHQGLLDKKKGLFARRRMFLLTTGPRLFYVDPSNMVLKGEVPWSTDMRCEIKSFSHFWIHTPGRIYYLEDPIDKDAKGWVRRIDEVKEKYFGKVIPSTPSSGGGKSRKKERHTLTAPTTSMSSSSSGSSRKISNHYYTNTNAD